ncbi:MAG TPA: hypothetical protein VGC14_04190, partial [Rhizobium sp.]
PTNETTAFQQPSPQKSKASSETLERITSSPAAPPPSSVIGLIDLAPDHSQQPNFENSQKTTNH